MSEPERLSELEKLIREASAKIAEAAEELGRAAERSFGELSRAIRQAYGQDSDRE